MSEVATLYICDLASIIPRPFFCTVCDKTLLKSFPGPVFFFFLQYLTKCLGSYKARVCWYTLVPFRVICSTDNIPIHWLINIIYSILCHTSRIQHTIKCLFPLYYFTSAIHIFESLALEKEQGYSTLCGYQSMVMVYYACTLAHKLTRCVCGWGTP